MVDNSFFWLMAVALSAFVLFVETVRIVVVLFVRRQSFWRYLFVLLPLAVSMLSFLVAWDGLNRYQAILSGLDYYAHLSPLFVEQMTITFSQLNIVGQIQEAVTVIVFVVVIFLERTLILPFDRAPVRLLAEGQLCNGPVYVYRRMV